MSTVAKSGIGCCHIVYILCTGPSVYRVNTLGTSAKECVAHRKIADDFGTKMNRWAARPGGLCLCSGTSTDPAQKISPYLN